MGLFKKPPKEEPRSTQVGDFLVARIILNTKTIVGDYYSYPVTIDSKMLKGTIEDLYENAVKVKGEWYVKGGEIGDIEISKIIPNGK